MNLTDFKDVLFDSNLQIDNIIATFENTINLSVPSSSPGFTVATDVQTHNFGDSTYFQGIFTVDDPTDPDTVWNDFGAQTPDLSTPSQPVFQTVDVEAMIDSVNTNIYLINYYNNVSSSGTAYSVTYKIYLLSKNTMAKPITPLAINTDTYFNSNNNYQKIFKKGTTSISVTSGNTGSSASIAHNLGYIPKVRAFFVNSDNQLFALNQIVPAISGGFPVIAPAIEVHLTPTTLTFYSDQTQFLAPGVNGNIEYRIYYDD